MDLSEERKKLKWCKATWYSKGSSGRVESEAIPRGWVTRSGKLVRWPPGDINYKSAIESCMTPNNFDNWKTYVLRSCTASADSLEGARLLQTEMSGSEAETDENSQGTSVALDNNPIPAGRGHRVILPNSRFNDYVADEDDASPVRKIRITRLIGGKCGDITNSSIEFTRACNSSTNSNDIVQKTLAMKKAYPTSISESEIIHIPIDQSHGTKTSSTQDVNRPIDSATPKRSTHSSSSTSRLENLIAKMAAESKIRHQELLRRVDSLETKLLARMKSRDNLADDIDEGFCVKLPVQNFQEFDQLEEELTNSSDKRNLLRELLDSIGARCEGDFVCKGISYLIQRPQLAQLFNCGGNPKGGSKVEATEKRNFMGTQCQKAILRVLRKNYANETEHSLRSRLSNVLKRSSALKGGKAHNKQTKRHCGQETRSDASTSNDD